MRNGLSVAIGRSDAGLYVGQSRNVVVGNNTPNFGAEGTPIARASS